MDAQGTLNASWLDEINEENSEEIIKRARETRIDQWYEHLGINIKLIAKELPMYVKGFRQSAAGTEMSGVQFKIPGSIRKRTVQIREKYPRIFQTNSDIDFYAHMLGLDILEYVYKKHPEGLAENEVFQQLQFDNRYIELYALVNHKAFLMREISRSYASGKISKGQFLEEIKTVFDAGSLDVQGRLRDLYLAIIDEHGFKKEREKELTRLRTQRWRENKTQKLITQQEE